MGNIILYAVLSVTFFSFFYLAQKDKRDPPFEGNAMGTIKAQRRSCTGNVEYYIEIEINGKIEEGWSSYYKKIPRKIGEGDVVKVGYYHTNKRRLIVRILVDGFVESNIILFKKILLGVSLMFLAGFLVSY